MVLCGPRISRSELRERGVRRITWRGKDRGSPARFASLRVPNPLIDTPMAGKKRASASLSPEGSCPLFSARQLIAWTPCSGSKRTRNGRLGASAKAYL